MYNAKTAEELSEAKRLCARDIKGLHKAIDFNADGELADANFSIDAAKTYKARAVVVAAFEEVQGDFRIGYIGVFKSRGIIT
jgi:hypothetical protein